MPSLRSKWLRNVPAASGSIVTLIGVSVLVAWQFHLVALFQVLPMVVPMHRMTALTAAAAGIAMVVAALGQKRAAALCALVPLSISALVLAEYAFSADFGIDLLLGADYVNVHTSSPGRMSPASAGCLFLISLALIALSSNRLARWTSATAGIIGTAQVTIGSVNLWSILLLRREVFAWGNATRLSVLSSISYALLGGGLLALAVRERRGRISGWTPVAVGVSAGAGVLGVWQALVEHNEGDWPLISNIVMAGGLFLALLLALAVYQTQRARRRSEALRQSEERFRQIFEESPIAIAVLGRDFHPVKANTAYCRMFGYSETELTAMTPLDFTHPDDRAATQQAYERFFTLEKLAQRMEKRYVRKTGEVMWGAVTTSAIHDTDGKPLYKIAMIEDITERKHAEEELRALTQRLSLATRSASVGVWEWSLKTNLSIWDDMMFQIFAIPKHDGLARQEWVRMVHPEDKAKVKGFSYTIFQEKTQDEVEFRIIRPDGTLRHVTALGGAVLDERGNVTGMVGVAIDITERKQEEEKLRALSTRFAQATQFASMAVWEWDPRTRTHVWDDTGFAMAGLAKTDSVPHETWMKTVHPEDLVHTIAALQRIVQSKTQESMEFRVLHPNGAVRHLYAAGGPVLDRKGEVSRVVGIAIDITERKQLEAELEATREQAVASARLSALGMMAGGVAHEINNPLSIIHAMASDLVEMVAKEGSAPAQIVERKSAVIRETAERIARIVKSLLQISREGPSDSFHPTPVAKILAETLHICRAKFAAHDVELLLPRRIPELNIPCREVQIAQALLNLLQNAFDAVLERQGKRWVRLDVKLDVGSVVISVIDNGPGVPLELRPRLMEPFFTTKPVGKGTGLGLSLSKTIAEDHGGRLEYGEEQGYTRFTLVLPAAHRAEAA
jgi:PAS domain S-box-containing protein